MKVRKHKDVLRIELQLEKPRPSGSGKTMLVASTHGVKATDVVYEGHHISVVANAFTYPKKTQDSEERRMQTTRKRPI